jgi:hypothetical protein
MRKGAAEVGAIHVREFLLLGDVDVFAARAEHLDAGLAQLLAHSDGNDTLALTHDSGAVSEPTCQLLFSHHRETTWRQQLSGVDKPVEVGGVLIQVQELIVLQIVFIRCFRRQNHLQCFVLMLYFGSQPLKVEIVRYLVFVYFSKEIMPFDRAKPLDPTSVRKFF